MTDWRWTKLKREFRWNRVAAFIRTRYSPASRVLPRRAFCSIYWRRNMKLQWKLPIVGAALVAFAACNQNAPVSPSEQLGSNLAGSQSGDQDRGATGQPVD